MVDAPITRCWALIQENRIWALMNLAASSIVTLCIAAVFGFYFHQAGLASVRLVDHALETRDDGRGYWLIVHYEWSDEALRCGRTLDMKLYPTLTAEVPEPIPLMFWMGGPNLRRNTKEVRFRLPIYLGTKSGRWWYEPDLAFFCPPLRLIPVANTLPPVAIDIL